MLCQVNKGDAENFKAPTCFWRQSHLWDVIRSSLRYFDDRTLALSTGPWLSRPDPGSRDRTLALATGPWLSSRVGPAASNSLNPKFYASRHQSSPSPICVITSSEQSFPHLRINLSYVVPRHLSNLNTVLIHNTIFWQLHFYNNSKNDLLLDHNYDMHFL